MLLSPWKPRGPYPHGAPHGSLLRVVGLHLQDVRGVLLPVEVPHASHHQPGAGIDAEVVVLVSWQEGKAGWMLPTASASVLVTRRALPGDLSWRKNIEQNPSPIASSYIRVWPWSSQKLRHLGIPP